MTTYAYNRGLFRDLVQAASMRQLWMALGYEGLRHVYRRTLLGFLWVAIAFLAFSLIKIVIFSQNGDSFGGEFVLWVVAGFLVWQFISSVVISGTNVFIDAEAWIKGVNLPLCIHVLGSIWRACIQEVIALVVAIALMIWLGGLSWSGLLLGLIAIPFFLVTAIPTQIVLGLLCVFSRDFNQFIGVLMRLMFFATPIIWTPTPGTFRETVALWNPFSYFLALFRKPIMTGEFPANEYAICFAMMVLLWGIAFLAFRALRGQLPYRL